MPEDAVLLIAAVIGLYIYDSALLLRRDEGVLIPGGRGEWSVGLGTQSYQLMGKYLFVPNPFMPHRPVYKATWRVGEDACRGDDWDARRNALRPLAPMVWGMAVAFFVLLPLGFFTRLGNWALLAAIMLLYVSIVAALAWAWKNRSRLMLSRRQYAAFAFECLVCSPLAMNMIRRLSAYSLIKEDLISASRRLQTPAQW
jgi:hypothetical protein